MAETIVSAELDEEIVPSSYTSETESAPAGAGQSITAPGAGLGRRKEAVARVRLVPGSGKWTINGRTLEDYFPNKLHQQLVKSPFVLLDIDGRFDVIARINGGGISGRPAPCASACRAPSTRSTATPTVRPSRRLAS